MNRRDEIVSWVLEDFAADGLSPGRAIPVRTLWLASLQHRADWAEVHPALVWMEEHGLLSFKPGGVAGLGSVALTEAGYALSRSS